MHKLNSQGFTIISLNTKRVDTFMKPVDAAFIFDLEGHHISVSTGNSAEGGGCLQSIYVLNKRTKKEFYIENTVEFVINQVMAGEYDKD